MGDLRKTLLAMAGNQKQIVIPRALVSFAGSLDAAILLNQIMYWSSDGENGQPRCGAKGWIAKTEKMWVEELCLSGYAIRKARKALEELGVIDTCLRKWAGSPTTHYRLADKFEDKWIEWLRKMDSTKTENPICEMNESSSETTSETTYREDADPSPSGDAVQPALIQTASDPVEKESDTRKELELVLIDHFVEASRIERPIRRVKADYKADQTRWRKPIQVIAGLVDWDTGESIRLLDATLERLLGGALTVSSPLSLVETARSIKGEWARGQPVNGRQPQPVSVGGGQRWG